MKEYGHCEIRTHDFFTSARFQDECLKPDSTKYPLYRTTCAYLLAVNVKIRDSRLACTQALSSALVANGARVKIRRQEDSNL